MTPTVVLWSIASILIMVTDAFATQKAGMTERLNNVQVPFMLNQGQADPQVKFYAKTFSGAVYVTRTGDIVHDLPKVQRSGRWTGWSLKEELIGASIKAVEGEERAPTSVSLYLGNKQSQWQSDILTYGLVSMADVYNGVDVKLRAHGGSVEKLFYVDRDGKPGDIKVRISGATSLRTNQEGELEASTGLGTVIFSRPRAYQILEGQPQDVDVAYEVTGNTYGFVVGPYDNTRELVIDPLIQSTYLGGNGGDTINAMAVSGGNVYVAGDTNSTDFPKNTGGAQSVRAGPSDAFVALLTSDLKTLIQTTYLGGTADDTARAIAVSGNGVYVAGSTTSTDFPKTTDGARPSNAGVRDAFVALLTSDLKTLTRATYYGGVDEDRASALGLFGSTAYGVFIGGLTASCDLVGTVGAAQPLKGDPCSGPVGTNNDDGFVAAFASDLKTLTQATYMGGLNGDEVTALVVSSGFVYAAGRTLSFNFPWTAGGAQVDKYPNILEDSFVARLTSDLTTPLQATYLGGNQIDLPFAMVLSADSLYVAGSTASSNFPGTAGHFQPLHAGGEDGFVARLSTDLHQLLQSTYVGGSGTDRATAIDLGESFFGTVVYVAGLFDQIASPDGFTAVLRTDLGPAPAGAPYIGIKRLGGSGRDSVPALAAEKPATSAFNVYVAGGTDSTDFPNNTGGAQPTKAALNDGFVTKLVLVPDYLLSVVSPITVAIGGSATTTVTLSSLNGLENELVKLYVSGQPNVLSPLPAGLTASFLFPGDQLVAPVNDSINTTVQLNAASFVTPSTYTLALVGLPDTPVTHSIPITVNVVATFTGMSAVIGNLSTAGCIDNAGIVQTLNRTLAAAQTYQRVGQTQNAVHTLNAMTAQIQAQKGKHIANTCTAEGVTFDPAALLISDVEGLISRL